MSDTLADELAIRALVARYADAVNRANAEDWGATWAETGEWHLMGHVVRGRAPLVEFWRAAMSQFRWVLQLVHTGEIELAGDRGRARWYLSEVGESTAGDRLFTVGVYHDDYTRTAEGWRFARRRFAALYQGPPDLTGRTFPFPPS